MKFAFSITDFANQDPATLAEQARQYGFDGVEITPAAASTSPDAIRNAFETANVTIACLATDIAVNQPARANDLLAALDLAKQLNCPLVKLNDMPNDTRASGLVAATQWLAPLADAAAQRGLTLLIENQVSSSKELWLALESIDRPAIGVAWDVDQAALNGESSSISVPILNSRIHYVQIRETAGDNFDMPRLFTRLAGIGYNRWIRLTAAEERLASNLSRIKAILAAFETPAPRRK